MIYSLFTHHCERQLCQLNRLSSHPLPAAYYYLLPEVTMPSDLPGSAALVLSYPTAVRIRQLQFTLQAAYCSPYGRLLVWKMLCSTTWMKSLLGLDCEEVLHSTNQLGWANETCSHKTLGVLYSLIFYNHAILRCNETEKALRVRLINTMCKEILLMILRK